MKKSDKQYQLLTCFIMLIAMAFSLPGVSYEVVPNHTGEEYAGQNLRRAAKDSYRFTLNLYKFL